MRLKWSFLAIKENAMSGANPTPHITLRTPSPQWSMVMAASCCGDVFPISRDWGTGQNWRNAKYREILEGNLFQSSRDLRLGRRFTFQQNNDPKHTAKATLEWFKGKHWNVLEWPSQSPDLNPIKNLWYDLKIAVHHWNTSNWKELEQFCLEEWAKIPNGYMYQAYRDIPQETCSSNCCKRWLYKVLNFGGGGEVNSYACSGCLFSCLFRKKKYFASSRW